METSPNVSLLKWVTCLAGKEFKKIGYLTKRANTWWELKDFVNYS